MGAVEAGIEDLHHMRRVQALDRARFLLETADSFRAERGTEDLQRDETAIALVDRLGLIDTELHDRNGQVGRVERMAPTLPMRRAGTPAEVAEAVCWLLGERSSYTTGAHLDVSGGR